MRLVLVDAFTTDAFSGNPAAVCILESPRDPDWMQKVAAEMNLSETAFVRERDEGFDLRWFTPKVEVDLCGHATLASAHVLWSEGLLPADGSASFHTRSGTLTCELRGDGVIEMDFPQRPVSAADPAPGLVEALGVEPVSVWSSAIGFVVELASEHAVRSAAPDMVRLGAVPEGWTAITAAADAAGFDFVSRYFAPQSGIDEDPVTGSAHCALADLWSKKTGRRRFRALQCSARGGVVDVRLEDARVVLGGRALTVVRGELVA